MPAFADRVKETTATTGTGTLTLDGAATGFQSFTTAFGNGVSVYYVIAGGSQWEVGIGTTGAGTLSRDTVLQSTNADALVNFAAGTKDVFCSYVADRAVTTVDAATLTNKTISGASNTLTNIPNSATTAASASTNSAIVSRDANGSSSFKNVKLDGTTSGTVTVQPAATAGTWALTLPTSGGTNGQVLTTNGSGVTSWSSVGGQTQQTQSGTYNLSSADVGKQIIHTGSTASSVFYLTQSDGAAITNGQFIDVVNAGGAQISFGGAQVLDSVVANVSGSITSSVRYSDGRVLLVGQGSYLTRNIFIRLNADGTVDNSFAGFTFNSAPECITLSADETAIYVGGGFTSITDVATSTSYSRNYIAKFNGSTGAIDTAWNPGSAVPTGPQSVAVSGTTVVAASYVSPRIAFMSSTTGANLGTGVWYGEYSGVPNSWAFRAQPYIRAHPTQSNTFIGNCAYGTVFTDGDLNQTYFDQTLFHFTKDSGPTFFYNDSISRNAVNYVDGLLVTSTHIYQAASTAIYRYVLGSQSGGTQNGGLGSGSSVKSIIIRPSDSAVFVTKTNSTGVQSVFAFLANLGDFIALPTLETWSTLGIVGQFLGNGKLAAGNFRISGSNYTLALLVSPLQTGATIYYPPFQSGSSQANGFTSTTSQSFRQFQSMRVQKINGQLYIVQRNTPFQ